MRRFLVRIFTTATLGASASATALDLPQWRATFDVDDLPRTGHSADAMAGVIVNVSTRVVALTPDGTQRWTHHTCPGCKPNEPGERVVDSVLLGDGSAWLLTRRGNALTIVRIAADGTPIFSTDAIDVPPSGVWWESRLVGDADSAMALASSPDIVHWARVSSTGTLVAARTHTLAAPREASRIQHWKAYADGSVAFSAEQRTPMACHISPPTNCLTPRTTVFRLNTDGTERWRTDFGNDNQVHFVGFENDGSIVAVATPHDADLRVTVIAPDGVAGAAAIVPDTVGARVTQTTGPINGRYFVWTPSSVKLIDRTGATLVTVPYDVGTYGAPIASGPAGFIVEASGVVGTLLSPDDLAPLARFNFDDLGTSPWRFRLDYWQMLADGSIYTMSPDLADPPRGKLSRFAVPGSPAADRVFREGLETF